MGRKEWKYRWTRISNGVKSDKINGLSLDEGASFVPDRGKNNDLYIKPKDRRDEQISNGVKSDKINGLSLDEGASFVPDRGKNNDLYIKPKDRRDEQISNGVKSDKINGLSLDEGASFVPDRGKNNDIHIKTKDRQDEQIPEAQPEKEEEIPSVGIFALFRYASTCDVILIVIAIVIAIISGMSMPGIMIIFGYMIDKMINFVPNQNGTESNMTSNKSISKEEFLQSASELCLWNTLFGVALFVGNYVFVSFFSLAAANQAFRIRCLFMKAVLKQDMAWYDTHQTGDFATRITGDLTRIQDGLGEKVGICISFISTTLFCIGTGIYYGWKLALVILSLTPLLTAAMAVMSKIQASVSSQELEAYGSAGAVAEEVLSSIRTVVAFSGQQKEIQRYEACLIPASRKGIKRGLLTALGSAITWLCLFGGYALAFWYGVKLIIEDIDKPNPEYTGGTLIIIFFNVISASMFIGQTAPYFEAFALARGAAAKVYSIIERQPSIDSSLMIGLQPPDVEGHIRLTDVYFNYPSRPTVPILNGLNLEVKPGETVALVGSSGCGKSTIVQLLFRFYDTNSGSVELDGIDVKALNLGWLRDHIGMVGQEPVLFSTTIEENIRMGRNDATFQDIVEAAKTANAHNFIEALPMKYQTSVGERGTQLSGGQKQRIAIARALVRNPRILLLDEATSALDTESESVVQAALDEARRGRTTIVVAHRLSTIRTADKIVVLDGGVVKETGTHEELMQAKGIYYNLVVAQTKDYEEEADENDDADCIPQFERRTSVISVGSDEGQKRRGSKDRQISAFSRQISAVSQQLSSVTRQVSKTSAKGIDEDDEDVDTSSLSQVRLFKLAMTDWPYVLIGGLSALFTGVYFPLYGIILGDILGVLSEPVEEIESKNLFFCFIFLGMAVTSAVFGFLQIFLFSIAGEKLTFRLRKMVFANLISQDIAFFDDAKNSVGSLCSRLNSDASSVQGATGSRISTLLQAISTMGVCIFIGLFYNWKIGLVTLSFVPLVLVAAMLEMQVISGHMHAERKGMEQASKVATEAIENIRTVASLHQETKFFDKYCNALLDPHRKSRLKSHVRGIAYGFSQGVSTLAYSASMYYGCLLVANEGLLYSDLIKNLEGIMMGAMMVGQAVAFTPDYEKARVAAVRIFRLLELRPTIDAFSVQGMVKPAIEGSVDFSAVQFSYPTRPQIRVLRGLDSAVKPGQTVALVGSSGCGKSTCVQLLERFYDPSKGKVMVDCDDIRDLNLSSHRSHLALVSQEPVLFGRSIAENIAYGDNSRQPDMNEIIEVARQANIHGFVSSLPQGYDTPVGDRGTQLSGGQKQRIAIARALIRNPRILLLDEATSALDAESEKVVQEALDVARNGRTCLVIAHRLTTIVNADLILVLHRGKIVEKGTHQELINRKGIYYGLHNTQGQDSQ